MHRILLALAALTFIASPCIAEADGWLTDDMKTVTGTIDKFMPVIGGPPFSTFALGFIVTDSGEKVKMYFSSKTVFTDANGKVVDEGMWSTPIKKGEKAEVRYSAIQNDSWKRDGENGAATVHYLNYVTKRE